jgi:2-phosphosulfolactate phosphatase
VERRRLSSQFLARWEVADTTGAVVVVDVIRAFSTAAAALAAGAREIHLVDSVDEALAFKAAHPEALAMGENHGLMPDGFDLPNSPVLVGAADVAGRVLVQRTSAGTRGVVAARSATRMWCASLVCASATARAVADSGLGDPTYVITGRHADAPDSGDDDLATAEFIERLRLGDSVDPAATAAAVARSGEARFTLALGSVHVHPGDIAYATNIDAVGFAMEVDRSSGTPVIRAN